MAPMRTYTLRWSSKFTHIYKNVLSPSSIFMKFVSDHSLYEKSAVHACVGLLCVSTSSDQVQNLHAALTSCYLHLLFSWSFSNITSSMGNQPCMQVLGFCAWVHTPIKFLHSSLFRAEELCQHAAIQQWQQQQQQPTLKNLRGCVDLAWRHWAVTRCTVCT